MTLKKQEQSFFSWCTANIYGWDWIRSDQNEKQFTFIKQLCSFEIKLTTFYHFSRLFPGLEKFAGHISRLFQEFKTLDKPSLQFSANVGCYYVLNPPPLPPPPSFSGLLHCGLKRKKWLASPWGMLNSIVLVNYTVIGQFHTQIDSGNFFSKSVKSDI